RSRPGSCVLPSFLAPPLVRVPTWFACVEHLVEHALNVPLRDPPPHLLHVCARRPLAHFARRSAICTNAHASSGDQSSGAVAGRAGRGSWAPHAPTGVPVTQGPAAVLTRIDVRSPAM